MTDSVEDLPLPPQRLASGRSQASRQQHCLSVDIGVGARVGDGGQDSLSCEDEKEEDVDKPHLHPIIKYTLLVLLAMFITYGAYWFVKRNREHAMTIRNMKQKLFMLSINYPSPSDQLSTNGDHSDDGIEDEEDDFNGLDPVTGLAIPEINPNINEMYATADDRQLRRLRIIAARKDAPARKACQEARAKCTKERNERYLMRIKEARESCGFNIAYSNDEYRAYCQRGGDGGAYAHFPGFASTLRARHANGGHNRNTDKAASSGIGSIHSESGKPDIIPPTTTASTANTQSQGQEQEDRKPASPTPPCSANVVTDEERSAMNNKLSLSKEVGNASKPDPATGSPQLLLGEALH